MKIRIAVFLVFLAMTCQLYSDSGSKDIVRRANRNIFFLSAIKGEEESYGNAVLFAKRGNYFFFLTCDHIVAGSSSLKLLKYELRKNSATQPKSKQLKIARPALISIDGFDLALIKVHSSRLPQTWKKIAPLEKRIPTVSQSLYENAYTCGFPGFNARTLVPYDELLLVNVKKGAEVFHNADERMDILTFTTKTLPAPGMSGSPIFDRNNKWIGIILGRIDGEEVVYGVSIRSAATHKIFANAISGSYTPKLVKNIGAINAFEQLSVVKSKISKKTTKPAGNWQQAWERFRRRKFLSNNAVLDFTKLKTVPKSNKEAKQAKVYRNAYSAKFAIPKQKRIQYRGQTIQLKFIPPGVYRYNRDNVSSKITIPFFYIGRKKDGGLLTNTMQPPTKEQEQYVHRFYAFLIGAE